MPNSNMQRLVVALLVALPFAGSACINIIGTNVHGHEVDADVCSDDLPSYIKSRADDRALLANVKEAEEAVAYAPSLRHRNNLGAALMYAGEFQEALELLLALEADMPGHYEVAANLGTAYELTGRNAEAREWIAKGIARNVKNHGGTEWLHLRILDAKLASASQPGWALTHSVLGTDFGIEAEPKRDVAMPVGNDARTQGDPRTVQAGVCYQLRERLPFTPKPDAIVASALFDAGNIAYHHDTLENALKLYQLAGDYGFTDPALLERRVIHTQALLKKLRTKPPLRRSK